MAQEAHGTVRIRSEEALINMVAAEAPSEARQVKVAADATVAKAMAVDAEAQVQAQRITLAAETQVASHVGLPRPDDPSAARNARSGT